MLDWRLGTQASGERVSTMMEELECPHMQGGQNTLKTATAQAQVTVFLMRQRHQLSVEGRRAIDWSVSRRD